MENVKIRLATFINEIMEGYKYRGSICQLPPEQKAKKF